MRTPYKLIVRGHDQVLPEELYCLAQEIDMEGWAFIVLVSASDVEVNMRFVEKDGKTISQRSYIPKSDFEALSHGRHVFWCPVELFGSEWIAGAVYDGIN